MKKNKNYAVQQRSCAKGEVIVYSEKNKNMKKK